MNEIVFDPNNWISQPGDLFRANDVILTDHSFGFGAAVLAGVDLLTTGYEAHKYDHGQEAKIR